MANSQVSAKRFTKIHFFKQNILNMAVLSRMLGNTDESQPSNNIKRTRLALSANDCHNANKHNARQ
jgi:hypothetical protein